MHQFTDLMSAHCHQASSHCPAAAEPFHPWLPPSSPHQNFVTLLFFKCFTLCTPLKQHTPPNHTQPPKNKAVFCWSGKYTAPSHPIPGSACPGRAHPSQHMIHSICEPSPHVQQSFWEGLHPSCGSQTAPEQIWAPWLWPPSANFTHFLLQGSLFASLRACGTFLLG